MFDTGKSGATFALFAILLLAPGTATPAAQQDDDWCESESRGRNREGVCEVRPFTTGATSGMLSVAATNGGIQVEGQARADVHVLARVVAHADNSARAREIADAVRVNVTVDRIDAEGPQGLRNREGWSVSYRVAVPRGLNLSLRTTNGGISIREVDSHVEFQTTNGGVKLAGVGGNVRGRTSNGGINVDLDGTSWNGEGLDVETSNGGVTISIPQQYSARLEVSTHNGGLRIDHPDVQQRSPTREIDVQLGAGGPPIKVRTSNGGVSIRRK